MRIRALEAEPSTRPAADRAATPHVRAVEAVDEHRWPPNWWRAIRFDDDTDASSACRSVAALIVATLLGVHRIPETEPLELQSFPATPCRVCKR